MSALERIAAAIADGTPVDWTTVESSATDEADRALVRELRLVADLASFHATLISPAGRPPHDLHDSILHPPSETSAGTEPSQTAGDPPPVGWGPLRVIEKIGRGTFGDVYRAWDPRLDRDVALKLLRRRDAQSDELDSTVIEEGRLQARVRHPGVITIHGADRIDGRVGLWMELIQGPTLEQELRERGPRSAEDAATVGIELCRALSAVHETGLVHRDVKAQNVIRDETGRLVLGDFGTGQALEEPDADRRASLAGTPLYLAPELFDRQPATVESDLYGLGVLLYHLVTGSFPIRGRTIRQLRQAHRENRRTFLSECRPDLPVPFVRAVERALDPNPEERFGRATDLAAALEECLPLSARTPGASALGQPSPVWSTKPLLAVGGAALILLSVVTFWQWASPPGEQGSSSQRVAPPTVLASAAPQSRRILNTSIGGATAVSPDGRLLVTKLWDGDQWGNLATYDRGSTSIRPSPMILMRRRGMLSTPPRSSRPTVSRWLLSVPIGGEAAHARLGWSGPTGWTAGSSTVSTPSIRRSFFTPGCPTGRTSSRQQRLTARPSSCCCLSTATRRRPSTRLGLACRGTGRPHRCPITSRYVPMGSGSRMTRPH